MAVIMLEESPKTTTIRNTTIFMGTTLMILFIAI